MKRSLVALAKELGLNGSVRFFDPQPVGEIAEIMANADLGVVPKRADSFGNEAYGTKIMEFMALGVPVVVWVIVGIVVSFGVNVVTGKSVCVVACEVITNVSLAVIVSIALSVLVAVILSIALSVF